MANAMNHVELEKKYLGAGWTMDMDGKTAKLTVCPACCHVNTVRRARVNHVPDEALMTKSARKMRTFRKDGRQPVEACTCGYRRNMVKGPDGDLIPSEQPGSLWVEEFGNAPLNTKKSDPISDRTGKCSAVCKTNKKPCGNNAVAGSDKCNVHGGKRLF